MAVNDYNGVAAAYAEANEQSLENAYYERPATLGLLGDVSGKRVLDAGCGAGPLMAELKDRGALVAGFDSSSEFVDLARGRLGDDADVTAADITKPFPYEDNSFDAAACSLVLHYFDDWSAQLAEFRRVLTPGGRLVVSVEHPMVFLLMNPGGDYFAPMEHTADIECNGTSFPLTMWHRPLHALCDEFVEAGFTIRQISEPPYSPDTPPELLTDKLKERKAFVCFLFFQVENTKN